MAPLPLRMRQARAVARHPRLVVTDIEQALRTRATYRTLLALRERFPRTRFVWLMGADNLADIHRWEAWQRIFNLCPVAIIDRGSYSFAALRSPAACRFARRRVPEGSVSGLMDRRMPAWAYLGGPRHPASATAIRNRTGWFASDAA